MKALTINQSQKDKLIEMANKLFVGQEFSGHPVIKFLMSDQSGSCHYHSREKDQIFVYISSTYGFPIDVIHWFEFVMLSLAPKIIPAFIDMEEFYSGLVGLDEVDSYQKHPIDYLYELYKKL